MTDKEVAAILRLDVKTVRNQRWRGDGPPFIKFQMARSATAMRLLPTT
jgi:hypothetical protein